MINPGRIQAAPLKIEAAFGEDTFTITGVRKEEGHSRSEFISLLLRALFFPPGGSTLLPLACPKPIAVASESQRILLTRMT